MKKYLEQLHIIKLFHLKDIVSITGNERSGQELLLNYKKQGLVTQIRRDLYTVTDLATKANIATNLKLAIILLRLPIFLITPHWNIMELHTRFSMIYLFPVNSVLMSSSLRIYIIIIANPLFRHANSSYLHIQNRQ